MKIPNSIIKLMAVTALGGAAISTAPSFVSGPALVAQAKSCTLTTKEGISVYNAKNLKEGDHYIPSGVKLHYREEKCGVRVWSNSKLPKYDHHYEYYLQHNKNHHYMVTYNSLTKLGIKPKSSQQALTYLKHQKAVNTKMKKMFNIGGHKNNNSNLDYGPTQKNNKNRKNKAHNKKNNKIKNQKNLKAEHMKAEKAKEAKRAKKAKENQRKKQAKANKAKKAAQNKKKMAALKRSYNSGKEHRPHTPEMPTSSAPNTNSKSNNNGSSTKSKNDAPEGKTLPRTSESTSWIDKILNLL